MLSAPPVPLPQPAAPEPIPAEPAARPVPQEGQEVVVAGLVGKVVRIYGPPLRPTDVKRVATPGADVDVLVTPPGCAAMIRYRVPYSGPEGWRTLFEVEAETLAQAQRAAAAGPSPLASLPRYDPPAVNARVVVDHRPALVVRVHRVDFDTPLDLAVYDPDGRPTLRNDVAHGPGPGQWLHLQEVLDRRAASLAADAGSDFEPRVGRWVRVALAAPPDGAGQIEVQPVRGLILRIEPVDVPERGGRIAKLTVRVFPLEPPADPFVEDKPLPGGERVAFPVCLRRVESVEQLHRGEWEPLGATAIKGGSFHETAANRVNCGHCRARTSRVDLAGFLVFEPRPGSGARPQRHEICSRCRADFFGL